MKLTPLDIHHKEFHRSIRGYNEEEVDLFLDQVYSEFERYFKENNNLKEKVEKLEAKVSQYEGLEQTLQNTLLTAQRSAEEVQTNAKKEADLVIKDAEMKAKQTLQDAYSQRRTLTNALNNLKAIEEEFSSHMVSTIDSFRAKIDKATKERKAIEQRIADEVKKLPSLKEEEKPIREEEKPVKEKQETETAQEQKPVEVKREAKKEKAPKEPKKEEPVVQEVNVEGVVAGQEKPEEEKTKEPVATLATNEAVDSFMNQGEAKQSGGFLRKLRSGFSKKEDEGKTPKEAKTKKKKKITEEIQTK